MHTITKNYCVISVLTLFIHFIVIAASGSVNKHATIGAVIRVKRGTEPGVHKLLANDQAGTGGYKFKPMINTI